MFVSRLCLGVGIVLAAAGSAPADEKNEARQREAKELLATVKDEGYYGLRDPKPRATIAKIQEFGADAVPAVAEMLAQGLKDRKQGWIQVYRPLFILEGLGEHAKAALPDVIKALDDDHPVNVGAAAKVLAQVGPAAKDALPKLEKIWGSETTQFAKEQTGKAIKAIDPKTAAKLGIE